MYAIVHVVSSGLFRLIRLNPVSLERNLWACCTLAVDINYVQPLSLVLNYWSERYRSVSVGAQLGRGISQKNRDGPKAKRSLLAVNVSMACYHTASPNIIRHILYYI